MTKKNFSLLFLLAATAVNILMTLVIIIGLIVIAMMVIKYLVGLEGQNAAAAISITCTVCFIAGIVLDMFLYAKLMDLVITRFHLEDKLDPRMLGKRGAALAAKEKASKPKTVLPKSVLGDEEEDTWGQTAYGDNSGYTPEVILDPEDATYTPLNPEDFAGSKGKD
ncbi:MAG: hypothetical protein II837_04430 [Treponema sp.]|nr:hypothetical protein [Treponema sp.]